MREAVSPQRILPRERFSPLARSSRPGMSAQLSLPGVKRTSGSPSLITPSSLRAHGRDAETGRWNIDRLVRLLARAEPELGLTTAARFTRRWLLRRISRLDGLHRGLAPSVQVMRIGCRDAAQSRRARGLVKMKAPAGATSRGPRAPQTVRGASPCLGSHSINLAQRGWVPCRLGAAR